MVALFVTLLISTTCAWYCTPRLFRYFDIRCANERLVPLIPGAATASLGSQGVRLNTSTSSQPRTQKTSPLKSPLEATLHSPKSSQDLAQLCDALARSSRTGNTAHEAIMALAPELSEPLLIAQLASISDEMIILIRSCIVDNYFIAAALDQASLIMRENHLFQQQVATAAAHSLLTIRILSWLPIGTLGIALLTQEQLQDQVFTTPMLMIFFMGISLNIAGRWWAHALIKKMSASMTPPLIEFTQHLCVSLRGGYSIHEALIHIKDVNKISQVINQQLISGAPLAEALSVLHQGGAMGISLANILLQAACDGLPVVHTVQQLSMEIRTERRIAMETKTQELPSKLTFPVVFCTLPSFLLLTVLPLVFSQLSNLSLPLPPS